MPQSTNLNTTPYFEDFDPNKKFHKVLFKPGVPLQARELTTLQSILQDQIEKMGSSIYKEGAMVVPGHISFDLLYKSVLIEDEYFGLPSSQLVEFIVGKTITGQSSGVRAKVVNAITAEQSEKGYTTLFIKYIGASNNNTSSTFEDDEILVANESFSIGGTVISENTDFAKCITNNATFTGSASSITTGIYYTKGYFVTVDPQEIILDQFGVTPSYKIGLQVLENIVSSTSDESLNDPSQGFSNFAAPGADRFKLEAKLVKKSLSDNSTTDFIELLRLDNGELIEIENGSLNQLDGALEDSLARRTYDESGNYEVEPYTFAKDECLDDGTNNGVFAPGSTTEDGNNASSELFEITISPGKSYVLGYELSTLSTRYVDIKKARKFRSVEDYITNTNARGFVFTSTNDASQAAINSVLNGDRIVVLQDNGPNVVGYALLVSVSGTYAGGWEHRVTALKFLNGKSLNDVTTLYYPTAPVNYENNTVNTGSSVTITGTSGVPAKRFFNLHKDDVIKSVEDVSLTDVRAFASGTFSSGTATLTNVKFNSSNFSDYTFVLSDTANTPGVSATVTPNLEQGELVIDIDNASNNGNFNIFGPTTVANPQEKLLNYRQMNVIKLQDIAGKYNLNDNTLGLGVTRVSDIKAVYIVDNSVTNIDEIIPNITLSSTQLFTKGEIIEGITTGAKGRVVDVNGTQIHLVYENDLRFIPNENIKSYKTNLSSQIISVANGVTNVKEKYKLNDGQTDQTFEFSSISKQNVGLLIPPNSDIYVIFDYFQDINVGSGLYTTINSFYNATFEEIPKYISSTEFEPIYLSDLIDFRIDQENILSNPNDGTPDLPYTINANDIIANTNDSSLSNYGNKNYQTYPDNLLNPEGYAQSDSLEYYIPTYNTLYLTKNGDFFVKEFDDSENKDSSEVYELKNAMALLDIFVPAGTRDLNDVVYTRYKNNRYTMKDIGSLENRIENLEYYTQLSLLETETENLFIPDSSGFNRLKNGFIVDNFTSHDIGEPTHPNYACSMDFEEGELRPQHYTTNSQLTYKNGITPSTYVRDNFILLNYDDISVIEQPLASGVENVNPFSVISWVGDITVNPATDDWVDEIRLPETTTNVEGNFIATAAAAGVTNFRTGGFAPTQWNAWQTQWTSRRSRSSRRTERRSTFPFIRSVSRRRTTTRRGQTRTGVRTRVTPRIDREVLGDRVVDITFSRWKRSRNIRFYCRRLNRFVELYPFFDGKDISTYVTPKLLEIEMLSGAFTPGERFSLVSNTPGRFFSATCLRPNGHPNSSTAEGLDGKTLEFNPYTRESLQNTYSDDSTILNWNVYRTTLGVNGGGTSLIPPQPRQLQRGGGQGGYLIVGDVVQGETSGARARIVNKRFVTNENGDLVAGFYLPPASIQGNPRWRVGESTILFTDSPVNSKVPGVVDSSAEGTYTAKGTILTKQTDVLLVRNANVQRDTVSESRVRVTRRSRTRRGAWRDPLAQSFLVPEEDGMFVTKVDTYFESKDTSGLPITMELRTMVNGYPSPNVLGTVTLTPDQVNVSDDATAVTTFTFNAPVFVEGLQEYCFAILTSSLEYKMWISAMGQKDLDGNRITGQPYAGVLFKSQNASTWTAHQLEDLKFKLYRAEFDITETPTIEFESPVTPSVGVTTLPTDPIELSVNNGYIKVNHPNHGMHDPASYVTIDSVSSGVGTTLASTWNGSPGTPIPLTGDSNIEGIFKSNSMVIDGVVGSATNPAYIRINDSVYSYNPAQPTNESGGTFIIDLLEQISGPTTVTSFEPDDNITVEFYIYDGVPLTKINTTHRNLRWITLDSYQIFLDVTRNSTDNFSFGGSDVVVTTNIMFTSVVPSITYQELPGTSVTAEMRTTSGTSISDSSFSNPNNSNIPLDRSYIKNTSYSSVNMNDNNYFENPKVIASYPNAVNLMQSQPSVDFRLTLSSTNKLLSPIIDAERISLITTSNRVSNIDGDYKQEYFVNNPGQVFTDIGLNAISDYNDANYISKLVSLQNPSTALRIEFAAYNPLQLADIDVLIKVLSGEETDPNEIDWIDLDNTNIFPENTNPRGNDEFVDQKYTFDITDLTPNGTPFTEFQIKIRMRSNNQSYTPLIKDLRCIALA